MPSRKKSRDASPGSADQYRADATAAEYEQPLGGAVGLVNNGPVNNGPVNNGPVVGGPVVGGPVVGGSAAGQVDEAVGGPPGVGLGGGSGDQPASSPGRLLKNWRVRSRLVLLIAIPTATAVALGGTSIVSSWRSAVANQRSETLASMSTKVTQLAYDIEAERDAIVWYIAAGDLGRTALTIGHVKKGDKIAAEGQLQIVNQQFVYTNPDVTTVKDGMAEIGSGYPAAVQASAAGVASVLKGLAGLRNTALTTQVGASGVITEYDKVVSNLLAFDDQVGLSSSDPQLASTARAFTSISRIEDEDSIQRAIVMYGLVSGSLGSGLLNQLNGSVSEQSAEFSSFTNFATPSQISDYNNALAQSLQDRVQTDMSLVIGNPNSLSSVPVVPTDWYGAMSDAILRLHGFEESLATSGVDRAQALRSRAIIAAIAVGSVILLVLVLSLLFTVFVGRSMVRPLRRLTGRSA